MNTQTVNLDVTKRPSVLPAIYIGQGDMNGTTLVANIYDDGTAFTLDNYGVRFRMKLPYSVATYYVDGTVSGSAATFAIDESYAASVAGVTDTAYVEVLDGDTVVCSTNRMRVVVLESAYEGVPPAHIWDNGITQFLSDAQDAVDAAVDDAEAATTRATQAAEAAEGVVLDALPTMSPTLKGGAILGSGLEIDTDTLSIDLTDEATGESVTAADASYLASLTVDGKAVQDGTPTPSNPVPVEVVALNWNQVCKNGDFQNTASWDAYGCNIAASNNELTMTAVADSTPWVSQTINIFASGRKFLFEADVFVQASQTATVVLWQATDTVRKENISGGSWVHIAGVVNVGSNDSRFNIYVNYGGANNGKITKFRNVQIFDLTEMFGAGNEPTVAEFEAMYPEPYYPYDAGSTQILLKTGTSYTPIDLQGNVLASLPDGTKDVLTVDSAGHVWIEQNVIFHTFDGSESYGDLRTQSGKSYVGLRTQYSQFAGTWAEIPRAGLCNRLEVNGSFAYNLSGNSTAVDNSGSVFFTISNTLATTKAEFLAWLQANPVTIYARAKNPQTIDLGYIDMPAILDGSTISITAQVTPTITASWWARGAAAIAEALKAVRARIDAIGAAIAELATA